MAIMCEGRGQTCPAPSIAIFILTLLAGTFVVIRPMCRGSVAHSGRLLQVTGETSTALPSFSSQSEELRFLRRWYQDTLAPGRDATPSGSQIRSESPLDPGIGGQEEEEKYTKPLVADANGAEGGGKGHPSRRLLREVLTDSLDNLSLDEMRSKIADLRVETKQLNRQKAKADKALREVDFDWESYFLSPEVKRKAEEVLQNCSSQGIVLPRAGPVWKGYACSASEEEIRAYMGYEQRGVCPDDWFDTQHLTFVKHCYSLPMRRCFSPTPRDPVEPPPFPGSVFNQDALADASVRWSLHECRSFQCLNTRLLGDCRNCFNMALESRRWLTKFRGSLSAAEVIALKRGSIRLGLDAGGGTGSFAARMALYNVTVLTTAMNIETVSGRMHGLPYMETIGLRGLIPLWRPHKARLPFFDGTLDLIHCVNSIKYLPMLEFEELLFDWDRVLRVGGIMWFEMFYAPIAEMPIYIALIEQLGYKRLHWDIYPKPDEGERNGAHIYLNCVIEKQVREDPK